MKQPKAEKWEEIEEIRESLKTRITEMYCIFCKPEERPEFKTVVEAEKWYKKRNYIAEKVVGNWVDNTISILENLLHQQRQQILKEVNSINQTAKESNDTQWETIKKGIIKDFVNNGGYKDYINERLSQQRQKIIEEIKDLQVKISDPDSEYINKLPQIQIIDDIINLINHLK